MQFLMVKSHLGAHSFGGRPAMSLTQEPTTSLLPENSHWLVTAGGREPPLESGPDRIRRVGQFQSVKDTK
jgi:hypothetical protein